MDIYITPKAKTHKEFENRQKTIEQEKLSQPVVNTFIFNDYDKKSVVKLCLNKMNRKIWTMDELYPIIQSHPYSKKALDKGLYNIVGDEIRLYLASISDDFIYVDADCWVKNIQDLKMDCVPLDGNEGSYFRGNRDTKWIKYWLDIYATNPLLMTNYQFRHKYPIERPTQDLVYHHYWNQ